ncbi:MAG: hypothetical protein GC179_27835 [Anaerolineaceae bacterium]|nr:hypothetical protein [Anaerolineaceae bacterium]
MSRFFYRLSFGLLLLLAASVMIWVGLCRGGQKAFPPILYSETSNLQLFSMNIGCASFWSGCRRSEQFLLEGLYSLPAAEWSPNGDYIAVHLNDGWMIYPTDCLLVIKTCEPVPIKPALQDNRIAWGPDGTTIASYATTSNVSTTIQTSGCWQGDSPCLEKRVILSDFHLLTELAWSGDGSRMAFSDYVQNGLVWLDTTCFDKPEGCGADLHIVPVGDNRISWPSFSADGQSILLMMDTSGNGTSQQLFIVDVESGDKEQITFRAGTAEYPDWSSDERYVLFSGFETAHSGDLELYLLDLQRGMTLPIMRHEGRDLAFASWGYLPYSTKP